MPIPEEAAFAVGYVSRDGSNLGRWLAVVGVILIGLGLWMMSRPASGRRSAQFGLVGAGMMLVISAVGYLGTEPALVGGLFLVLVLLAGGSLGLSKLRDRRAV